HPHLDVWLLVVALAAAYAVTVARVGPHHVAPGQAPITKLQAVCFSLGVAAVWLASDWPVHDIAEELNYSMHMVPHLMLSMVAAPLLLLGTPAWMLRAILRPPSALFRTVRFLARFLPALLVFNIVLVLTHWPAIVDASLHNHGFHFLVHALIFTT